MKNLILTPYIKFMFMLILIGVNTIATAHIIDNYQRYKVQTNNKDFDDVMYDLKTAIRNHNYRITSINRIGEAIIQTDKNSFIQANIVNFCNIEVAKEFIQRSLDYLLYMPCKIAVYEKEDVIVVESYLLTKKDSLHNKVNIIIKKIVNSAVEDNKK